MNSRIKAGILAGYLLLTFSCIGRQVYQYCFKYAAAGGIEKCFVQDFVEQKVKFLFELKVDSRNRKKSYFFDNKAKRNYENSLEVYEKLYPRFEGCQESEYLQRMDTDNDGVISESESARVLNDLIDELVKARRY